MVLKLKTLQIYVIAVMMISLATSGASAYASTNSASQIISQIQNSLQNSGCASGGSVAFSCNNLLSQNQRNFGSNVAAQENNEDSRGGDNDFWSTYRGFWGGNNNDRDNTGIQSISQSQSSNQRSNCASGGSVSESCNNLSIQNQRNFGSNAGFGSNGGQSGISQSQSSSQQSNCVSAGSTSGSCNNFNDQSQVNYGSSLFSQN